MIWSSISSVVGMAKVKSDGDDMDEDGSGSIALDFSSGRNRRHFGVRGIGYQPESWADIELSDLVDSFLGRWKRNSRRSSIGRHLRL